MRLALALVFSAVTASAQTPAPADLLAQTASGTSVESASTAHSMLMTDFRGWRGMLHAVAFLNHTDSTDSPRGGEKTFSSNWVMGMASRPLFGGELMLRTMLSLEPATIDDKRYPLLFQTGETADGRAIIDGQHPHDFFMELSAAWARPLGRNTLMIYAAPVGDPAIGPVAFPHRTSASEIPQAVLGHHYQDSTHIAYNVITAGLARGMFRLEASAFHGGEPDEDRWDIEGGEIDSWSTRLWFTPTPNLAMQVSTARLKKPEALEPGDAERTTASLSYNRPTGRGFWASTLSWGHAYKESHDAHLDSYIAESLLRFLDRHYVSARLESADKDELFPHPHRPNEPPGARQLDAFRVDAVTLGYSFDALVLKSSRTAIGANITVYRMPERLELFYGEDARTVFAFIRFRPGSEGHAHHGHHH